MPLQFMSNEAIACDTIAAMRKDFIAAFLMGRSDRLAR
jgi:hypothetical protein